MIKFAFQSFASLKLPVILSFGKYLPLMMALFYFGGLEEKGNLLLLVTLFGLCRVVPTLPIGGYIIRCAVDKKLIGLPISYLFSSLIVLFLINIYFFVMHPALLKDIFVFTLLGALAANYNICVGIYQSDIDEGNTRQQTIYFLFLAFWSVAIPALTYSMSSIETSVFFYFICVVTLCQCFSFYKVLNVRELKAYFQQTSSLLGLTVIAQFIYSMGIFAWISVDRLIILKQGPDLAVSQDHYAMVSVFASIFAGVASTVIIASRSRFLRVARQSNVQKICYAIGGTIIAISVVTYIINPSAIIAFPISLSLLGIVLSFLMIKALDTEHSMLLSGLILFGFSVLVFILLEYISLASGMLIILVAKFLLPLFVDKVLLFLKSRK